MNRTCKGVMTADPTCCRPGDTATDAARSMRSEDVGSIPVVDSQESRKLLGIVTDRDLAVKVVAEGLDPNATTVGDVMSTGLVTCVEDEDVQNALDSMKKHQVRRIPIVNADGKLVGIIAQADVATRLEAAGQTDDVVEEISR